MRYSRLGHSSLMVSEVCLGTMTFGSQNSEAEGHAQLDYALEQGINFIDTAEMYPVPASATNQGSTEAIVGTWLQGKQRDKIVLASKVAGHSGMTWIRDGARLDRSQIYQAIEQSLTRLRTDYLDLYQIHWPDRYVPKFGGFAFDDASYYDNASIEETISVMGDLIKEGKIRYFGLSNETPWGVCQYLRYAEKHDLPKPVSIQNAYNLLNRTYDSQLAEVSFHTNIPLLAYSPLAFGYLTGKYRQGALPEASRLALFPNYPQRYQHKVNAEEAIDAYAELAAETSLTELALRFVASRPFCGSTIIGATNLTQLAENVRAFEHQLNPDQLAAIDAIHTRYPNPCP